MSTPPRKVNPGVKSRANQSTVDQRVKCSRVRAGRSIQWYPDSALARSPTLVWPTTDRSPKLWVYGNTFLFFITFIFQINSWEAFPSVTLWTRKKNYSLREHILFPSSLFLGSSTHGRFYPQRSAWTSRNLSSRAFANLATDQA